jgi:hypothetical protein
MRALLATMQSGITLRADAGEVDARRKRRGAIETPRRGYMLHQARQPGTGYVNRRARPLRLLPIAERLGVAVRILVAVLSIFAVAVHEGNCSVISRTSTLSNWTPGAHEVWRFWGFKEVPRDSGNESGTLGPATASSTYVPRIAPNCTRYPARPARISYPIELHLSRLVQGLVSGSSK